MLFTEIKERLSGERLEYACELLEQSEERLVLRYDHSHGGEVAGVDLPRGSHCFAYYWMAYPYNVYHWMNDEGETVAFYVNLSGPVTIGRDYVQWTDLVVDVLIVPDERLGYRVEVHDEDEIPADLDAATYHHIEDALQEVMRSWPSLVRAISAHSEHLWHRLVGRCGGAG
jgi:protein associated with RNAse G/E